MNLINEKCNRFYFNENNQINHEGILHNRAMVKYISFYMYI